MGIVENLRKNLPRKQNLLRTLQASPGRPAHSTAYLSAEHILGGTEYLSISRRGHRGGHRVPVQIPPPPGSTAYLSAVRHRAPVPLRKGALRALTECLSQRPNVGAAGARFHGWKEGRTDWALSAWPPGTGLSVRVQAGTPLGWSLVLFLARLRVSDLRRFRCPCLI